MKTRPRSHQTLHQRGAQTLKQALAAASISGGPGGKMDVEQAYTSARLENLGHSSRFTEGSFIGSIRNRKSQHRRAHTESREDQ